MWAAIRLAEPLAVHIGHPTPEAWLARALGGPLLPSGPGEWLCGCALGGIELLLRQSWLAPLVNTPPQSWLGTPVNTTTIVASQPAEYTTISELTSHSSCQNTVGR